MPMKHTLNCDLNAFYSNEMLRRLPVGDFEEISAEEMEQIDWKNLDEDGVVMYSVCVDLDYDQSLRECHCQFPCAPERRSVPVE